MMQLTQGSDINWDPYDRVNFLCPLNHYFMAYEIQSYIKLVDWPAIEFNVMY